LLPATCLKTFIIPTTYFSIVRARRSVHPFFVLAGCLLVLQSCDPCSPLNRIVFLHDSGLPIDLDQRVSVHLLTPNFRCTFTVSLSSCSTFLFLAYPAFRSFGKGLVKQEVFLREPPGLPLFCFEVSFLSVLQGASFLNPNHSPSLLFLT